MDKPECKHEFGAATQDGWDCLQCGKKRVFLDVPRGLDFHCETALTQARMAKRELDEVSLSQVDMRDYEHKDKCEGHLASVIEQLEEMAAKLKAAKEAA